MEKSSDSSRARQAKESASFRKARSKAEEYASNPDKLNDLIDKASKKANGRKGPLDNIWAQLMACFRMIKAYARGTYRDIPWSSLVMIVASVVYFVMPIDLFPDFVIGLGLIDDAALLGWTLGAFGSDIDNYIEWESNHNG